MEYIALKKQYDNYKNEMDETLLEGLSKADFIMGNSVNEFEQLLGEYIGRNVIACGSGTDALQLIYMSYGVGVGDAVFCPDMTFIATIEPACMLGATPVFCEIDSESYNIDLYSLENQIQNVIREGVLNPKAIVAVDFLGNPANYDGLKEIAIKYNLILIEDAAQSIGAKFKMKKCGLFGNIAATSFFPSKPLGCYGDGGAVFAENKEQIDLIKSLRIHGKGQTKYDNIRIGINSRLDALQARVLLIKLKHLEEEITLRQKKALIYNSELCDLVKVPKVDKGSISTYAQYVIELDEKTNRADFRDYLNKKGVPTIIYYPNPLHKLPVFSHINTYSEDFEIANGYSERNVGIPFSAFISDEEMERVISSIKTYFG